MKNNIIDKIVDDGIIKKGMTIIVGFSGGPDSLCLLHSLAQIQEALELNLYAIHVNHMLRPGAQDEAMNAAAICENLDVECLIFEADCKALAEDLKISTEEAGRIIRYEIFDDVASDLVANGADKESIAIAIAHNADDQSETVLFRLLRGTGVHGLAGMPSIRLSDNGYLIVRPLLEISRAEIEEYISSNKLHPNMDESNEGTDYTRNKIRNELIPYLEENYNPNIRKALRRFAEVADCDDSFINDIAMSECDMYLSSDEEMDAVYLDISEIKEYPVPVNTRIVTTIMNMLGLETRITYELLLSIHKLIYSTNPSSTLDLPEGYKAIREYDKVCFTANQDIISSNDNMHPEENYELCSRIYKKSEYENIREQISSGEKAAFGYAAFDFDLFNKVYPGRAGELTIRTRREGDYISIGDGSKKIQDFYVDSKVKKSARESILLVCIGNEVLWVLPSDEFANENYKSKGKFSQNFQISTATERVLFLEVSEIL